MDITTSKTILGLPTEIATLWIIAVGGLLLLSKFTGCKKNESLVIAFFSAVLPFLNIPVLRQFYSLNGIACFIGTWVFFVLSYRLLKIVYKDEKQWFLNCLRKAIIITIFVCAAIVVFSFYNENLDNSFQILKLALLAAGLIFLTITAVRHVANIAQVSALFLLSFTLSFLFVPLFTVTDTEQLRKPINERLLINSENAVKVMVYAFKNENINIANILDNLSDKISSTELQIIELDSTEKDLVAQNEINSDGESNLSFTNFFSNFRKIKPKTVIFSEGVLKRFNSFNQHANNNMEVNNSNELKNITSLNENKAVSRAQINPNLLKQELEIGKVFQKCKIENIPVLVVNKKGEVFELVI